MEYKNSMGSGIQVRKIKGSRFFSSLFSKLVCIYMGILLIMLVILFVTFSQTFQSYFVHYTQNIMINQAKNIALEYEKAGQYSESKEDAVPYVRKRIEIMNEYLQATTWLVDERGTGYEFTVGSSKEIKNQSVDVDILKGVFEGRVMGCENEFKSHFSTPVMTIGYPIRMNHKVQYALLIHTPMPYILQTIDAVRKMILNVVGLVGTVVFIWIYFLARQMTRPLKEMNSAAKVIASGGFNDRIIVEGKDEIAQLGHSLNHMAEELDKIEENRKSFIANISHDLRSPLTSISGFVTAILDGTIDEANQEKYLKIVLSETQRLITMTNAILDLNRMQENMQLEKNIFNVNQMIERVVVGFEARCRERNIHLYTDLDENHAHVLANADGINRVIQNLLENAFKFVGNNGDILVRTKVLYNKLWVSVFNNGPSIPKEQQRLIWERFYKGDVSRGQDKNGIGIGLVIVKEIIKQHHEEVGVSSNDGEMVEFYFSLTLADENE